MKESLAVKYRPKTFDEVVGQEVVVRVLQKQIETNNIKHAYLLAGASGCGKSTLARILAREINKGRGEPLEIDAASNSGVDNIRNLQDNLSKRSLQGEYNIVILDEAHSLSGAAFQSLLKTIEEPNARTIFIFCTTDPQKIPPTIQNRVQRFDFGKIPLDLIKQRLIFVCKNEGFVYTDEVIDYIAKLSRGGMRNALTYLEKVASYNTTLTLNNCILLLGGANYLVMFDLVNALIKKDKVKLIDILEKLDKAGKDLKKFIDEFSNFLFDINKYVLIKSFDLIDIPKTFTNELTKLVVLDGADKYYLSVLTAIMKFKEYIKYEQDIKTSVEMLLLSLCR